MPGTGGGGEEGGIGGGYNRRGGLTTEGLRHQKLRVNCHTFSITADRRERMRESGEVRHTEFY